MEIIYKKEKVISQLLEEKEKMQEGELLLAMAVEHSHDCDGWECGTNGISLMLIDSKNIRNHSKEFLIPIANADQKMVNRYREEIEPLVLGGH